MRLLIKDLQPDTDYAVQLRSDDGKEVSPWSRKFPLHTAGDDTVPKTPTNVEWFSHGSAFVGTWDKVTQKVNGKPLNNFRYYRCRVTTRDGRKWTYQSPDERWDYDFSRNQAAFKVAQKELGFEVRTEDQNGNFSEYSEIIWANNAAPEPPVLESVTGIEGGIEIKWSASPSLDAIKYRVYVSIEPNFQRDLNTMVWEGAATAYTLNTFTFVQHYIAVTAVDDFDNESQPALGSATPISPFVYDDVPPGVPTNVVITSVGVDTTTGIESVQVSWDFNSDEENLAGFQIWYKKVSQPDYMAKIVTAPPDVNNFIVADLDHHFDYFFKVRAFDTYANYSDWSVQVNKSGVANVAPTFVPLVTVVPSQTSMTISWTTPPPGTDDDVTYGGWYEIEVDTDTDPNNLFPVTYQSAAKSNNITVSGLEPSTLYRVKIRAVDNQAVPGPWSATQTLSTGVFPLPPGPTDGYRPKAPTNLSATPKIGYVALKWDEVTRNTANQPQPNTSPIVYEVHMSSVTGFTPSSSTLVTQASGTDAQVATLPGPAATELVRGTTYYFRVIAKDADGPGLPSSEVSGGVDRVEKDDISANAIDASMIRTGVLQSAVITMGAGGSIRSNNWNITNRTGYLLDEAGLTIYNGSVSASLITAGTISGQTIAVGVGGMIRVDSTASIQSNNYSPGSTGWRLGSTGLEINGFNGTISATNITGGTFQAGGIYVSSGGGIFDANGYWSITPGYISIQNGNINASTITAGALRSSQPAVDRYGNYQYGLYAWQIDMQGDAVFGNAWVQGRLVVGRSGYDGVIQSANWSSGWSGWLIDASGNVEFNQARINGGLFRSQTYGGRVEVGQTGPNDYVDEVRFFTGSSVVSLRNFSGQPGTAYFSIQRNNSAYSNAFSIYPSSDGHLLIGRGYMFNGGTKMKFLGGNNGVQIRDYGDGGYAPIQASNIGTSSYSKFKDDIVDVSVDTASVLKGAKLRKWRWKNTDPAPDIEPRTGKKNGKYITMAEPESVGLLADEMPDFLLFGDGFSIPAAIGFLWESLKQTNERLDALEAANNIKRKVHPNRNLTLDRPGKSK